MNKFIGEIGLFILIYILDNHTTLDNPEKGISVRQFFSIKNKIINE